mgnify:CR=1 FL=1
MLIVIVYFVIQHSKYNIIFFDSLRLLTIFNILVNIYCVCLLHTLFANF